MKYLFVYAFISTFLLFGTELGYTNESPFYTHITYMFQHAGIAHLILNSVAFIGVFHTAQKFINQWIVVLLMLLCGFAASFLAEHAYPTVGASAMVYAIIGMYIGITTISKQIKIADTRKYLLFIVCVVVGLLVSLLKRNSNFLVHIYSLGFGFFAALPLALRSYQNKL